MTKADDHQGRKRKSDAPLRQRILFLGHSPLRGGAELCLDTLLRHLNLPREDVFVVFPWEGPLSRSARDMGYTVYILPITWWMNAPPSFWYYKNLALRFIPNIFQLVRLIKKLRVDLVYTNTVSIWESAFAARLAGVRHIWHCHEVLGPGTTKYHLLPMRLHYRIIDLLADRVVFESHSSKNACALFQHNLKSEVVYNSLRFCPEELAQSMNGDRQRFQLRTEDRVVAFIGQFNERKNPFVLVRAIARIKHLENLRCLLVGEGELRDAVAAEIKALGLENICSLMDFQSDVSSLMRCIDLLVLPSREESFGLVLVEAGAFGRPVIATRTQGPTEIVVDGETGFLVDVDNDAQLSEKMEILLESESERRRMGAAAMRRVNEFFSGEKNTRLIEQLIEEVISTRERGGGNTLQPELS